MLIDFMNFKEFHFVNLHFKCKIANLSHRSSYQRKSVFYRLKGQANLGFCKINKKHAEYPQKSKILAKKSCFFFISPLTAPSPPTTIKSIKNA
jgi:hypothetical protein